VRLAAIDSPLKKARLAGWLQNGGVQTVYRLLKYGQQYVDKGAEYYERRNRRQQIEFVRKKAAQLGLQITPAESLKLSIKKFLESRITGQVRYNILPMTLNGEKVKRARPTSGIFK